MTPKKPRFFGKEAISFERIRHFEQWYREFQKKIEGGFEIDKKISPERMDDIIYSPVMQATGLSKEEVKKELGNFTPAYVSHFFPKKQATLGKGSGSTSPDTTGRDITKSIEVLKKRKGARGYSEDLPYVLTKLASSLVKTVNTKGFFKELTDEFGVKVNLKDVHVNSEGVIYTVKESQRGACKERIP